MSIKQGVRQGVLILSTVVVSGFIVIGLSILLAAISGKIYITSGFGVATILLFIYIGGYFALKLLRALLFRKNNRETVIKEFIDSSTNKAN